MEGDRSKLFFEIVRLAKEIKPSFLFLENVSAIRTRGLDRVIEELTEIGYDLRWCMLSASEVGAKHKRERWFLLAHAQSNDGGGGLSNLSCEDAAQQRSENEFQNSSWQFSNSSAKTRVLADTESIGVQGELWEPCESASSDRQAQGEWGEQADTLIRCRDVESTCDVADTKQSGLERGEKETKRGEPYQYECEGSHLRHGFNASCEMADTGKSRLQGGCASGHACGERSDGNEQSAGCGEGEVRGAVIARLGELAHGISDKMDSSLPAYLRASYWQEEPEGVPRTTTEKEQRIERIKRLGNAVVPLQARTAFEYLIGLRNPLVEKYESEYEKIDF